ncbi:hypothetical protein BVX98_06170 [bacterium F11]|nr:hypothetical protein BVX98_06170 [bacterium F11]
MELLTCPSCQSKMEKKKEPDITVDRCPSCNGTWLDKGELNVLATGMSGNIEFNSIDEEQHKDKFKIRQCPKCPSQKLRKVDLLIYSDTIFDYCEKCGGFFLDKGEIQNMNLELADINKDKKPEEYRGTINEHLVRLDKINDVGLAAMPGGIATYAQGIAYLRISVYFKNPLGLGLRIYSEKWTDKFSKLVGMFNRQDIQIGNEKMDSKFIIQGTEPAKVKILLSKPDVQKGILDFVSQGLKIYNKPGTLEIVDKRVVYAEGPCAETAGYNVESDPLGIVKKMMTLVSVLEQA